MVVGESGQMLTLRKDKQELTRRETDGRGVPEREKKLVMEATAGSRMRRRIMTR